MKGVKCIKFLALFITSLAGFVTFSNVNATKHQITSIPLYNVHYTTSATQGLGDISFGYDGGIRLTFSNDNIPWNSSSWDWSKSKAPKRFQPIRDGDICKMNSNWNYRNSASVGEGSSTLTGVFELTPNFDIYVNSNSNTPVSLCRTRYGMDSFDWNSINPNYFSGSLSEKSLKANNLKSLDPYFYEYSSLVLKGSTTIDGTVYDSHGFTFSEIFGSDNLHLVEKPKSLRIGFGTLLDTAPGVISVSENSILEFNFSLFVDSNDGLDLTNFESSTATIHASIRSGVGSQTTSGDSGECTKSVDRIDEFGANLDFSCPIVITTTPTNGNFVGFNFTLDAPSGSDYFFDAHGGLINFGIEGGDNYLNLVTDNDSTPGQDIGASNTGFNPSSAPGAPGQNINSSANYNSSLSNLFNFSFIDPFQPIFTMFSNGTSCASIPTLASLLHSEETQVCPFFDQSIRQIMTPVFSIASAMIIFGFAVRWLGARSGNFIEDSGGVDSGGFHLQNKFRRGK